MNETTPQPKAATGRPKLDPKERFEGNASFRCHVAEKEFIKQQAQAVGLKPGPYCRARVLGIPLKSAGIKLDPKKIDEVIETIANKPDLVAESRVPDGLLHELSRLSQRFVDVGNLVNQLARDKHTHRTFTHDWEQVRDDLQDTRRSIVVVLDRIGELLDD